MKKNLGRWTLRQLRQTDAIVPLQSGTNQFDSQRVSSTHDPFLENEGNSAFCRAKATKSVKAMLC